MTPGEWAMLAASILVPLVGGFGAWMFRIDRGVTKFGAAIDAIKEHGSEIDDLKTRVRDIEAHTGILRRHPRTEGG